MAMISIRRSLLSSRSISSFLLRTSVPSRISSSSDNNHNHCCNSSHSLHKYHFPVSDFPAINFIKECHRGFAKGRKSKGDDDEGSSVETVDRASIKATATSLMEAAVDALSRELSKLRTGRASPGMLDHIIVETSGVKMGLSRLAVVSVIDPKTLSVTPYDANTVKEVENAIVSSPLGINPRIDGNRLIAPVPPLTKENIQAVCKVVSKSSEDVKQSIRRARQKALDTMKKAGSSFSKDDVKRFEKEVDELTKKFIKSAEDMCKAKEKEITSS